MPTPLAVDSGCGERLQSETIRAMKIVLAVVGLVVAVGCGGSQALDATEPGTAIAQAPNVVQACDYCPGNTAIRTEVYRDSTFQVCPCPSNPEGFFKFRVDKPFSSCEHIQCEYLAFAAGGCNPVLPDGGLPICPPP